MLLFYLSLIESEEDKSKFERLYNNYRKLMKYVAIEKLKDEYLAEDAVHEAFIKLARYIKGIDENDSRKTKAFLVIVVKSVCIDMIRKQKHNKFFSLEEIDNMGYVSNDSLKDIEIQDVYSAIESLSDTYREIIELKVYYDLSDKQIADIVGIENSAVRKRLQRGREILRKKLSERGEDYVSVKRNWWKVNNGVWTL